MPMKAKTLPILLTAALGLGALGLDSCKKPGDTIGVITVLNNGGSPVSGVTVKLIGVGTDGEPGGRIDVEETTDGNGKATFNFNELYKRGQAGFAVLDVYAMRYVPDTLEGRTIIKIEEEKTNETTVTVE